MDGNRLRRIPLFAGLDPQELDRVTAGASSLELAPGERLFSCGDPSDAFYLIEEGAIRIRIPASAVQEERTVVLEVGGFFGEMGLLRERTRMADATAEGAARLVRVGRPQFDELMSMDADLSRKVTDVLKERLEAFRRSEEVAERARREPRMLLFLSPGGHEGASFLCANLAQKLRDLHGKPTLAVDMHFQAPMLSRYLSALSDLGSFSQIFSDEAVTATRVRQAAADLGSGVSLLAGSGTQSILLAPSHVAEFLPLTRESWEYVLVDPGPQRSRLNEEVVRHADVAHVVCEATEDSIRRADELAGWLRGLGLDGRVRFVLNKVPEEPEVDPAAVERALGEDYVGAIAYSGLQAKMGRRGGAPVVLTHPRSQVAVDIVCIGRSLASQPTGPLDRLWSFLRWSLLGGE